MIERVSMLMPLFLIGFHYFQGDTLNQLSTYLHYQCLDRGSFDSQWISIYQALVCGKRLPLDSTRALFVKGGLIHLMVVSGAHLLFLEKFYVKIPLPFLPKKLRTLVLLILLLLYAITSRLNPPVLRALFSFCLIRFSQSHKLFLNPYILTCASGLLCLVYNPDWIYSYSLQLSWLAALTQNASSLLKKSVLSYLCILPVISRWHFIHPIGIFINWIFSPIIGSILFPLSFLSFIFKPLHIVVDQIWNLIFFLLQGLQFLPKAFYMPSWNFHQGWIWVYIIGIVLALNLFSGWKKRGALSLTLPS